MMCFWFYHIVGRGGFFRIMFLLLTAHFGQWNHMNYCQCFVNVSLIDFKFNFVYVMSAVLSFCQNCDHLWGHAWFPRGIAFIIPGVIGPSTTSQAVSVSQLFSSLPENQRIPQISGSATGIQLGDKSTYLNFFRVIPPDGAQIQVTWYNNCNWLV